MTRTEIVSKGWTTSPESTVEVDLRKALASFEDVNNRESDTAYFQTHVPWIAPFAYLHIIFKPLVERARQAIVQTLAVPRSLADFYRFQNGAILFSGALSIYGFHYPGQLFNRDDPFLRLPHNIEDYLDSAPPFSGNLLAFAGHSADGSTFYIDRDSSRVYRFERGAQEPSESWNTFEEWIHEEIDRLSSLVDGCGRPLRGSQGTH